MENLFFIITDPGDAILIPAPYYAMYNFDLAARANLQVIPVYGTNCTYTDNIKKYCPDTQSLESAYQNACVDGTPPKALLLTSPNNPLGVCYPESTLHSVIEWCEKRGIHLVSNELYAGTVYDEDKQYGMHPWLSIATLASRSGCSLGKRIHIIGGLSKDMAISGLRIGALYTESKEILIPLKKLNNLCRISSHTQHLLKHIFSDEEWMVNFEHKSISRLAARSKKLLDVLDKAAIPYLRPGAGFFLWIDLRAWLPNQTWKGENLIFDFLIDHGLIFTPGGPQYAEEPGFFRICFSACNQIAFDTALQRLKKIAHLRI